MGGLNLGLALGGSGQTRLDPRSALAQQLIAGAGSGPVAHPTQGYGRLAKMLLAAYLMKQGEKRETQGREAIQSALGQALGGPIGIDLPVPPEEFVPGQPATVSPRRQPDMAAALATLSGAPQTASVADMQKALLGEAFSERRWERDKGLQYDLLSRRQAFERDLIGLRGEEQRKTQGQSQAFQAQQQEDRQAFQWGMQGNQQAFQESQQGRDQAFQWGMQGDRQSFDQSQKEQDRALRRELQAEQQQFQARKQENDQSFRLGMQRDQQSFQELQQQRDQSFRQGQQERSQAFQFGMQGNQQAFLQSQQERDQQFQRGMLGTRQEFTNSQRELDNAFRLGMQGNQQAFQQSQQERDQSFRASQQEKDQSFRLGLNGDNQTFQARQNDLDRNLRVRMQGSQQNFQAGQQARQQAFQQGMQGNQQMFQRGQQERDQAFRFGLQGSQQEFQQGMQGNQQMFQRGQQERDQAFRAGLQGSQQEFQQAQQGRLFEEQRAQIGLRGEQARQTQAAKPGSRMATAGELQALGITPEPGVVYQFDANGKLSRMDARGLGSQTVVTDVSGRVHIVDKATGQARDVTPPLPGTGAAPGVPEMPAPSPIAEPIVGSEATGPSSVADRVGNIVTGVFGAPLSNEQAVETQAAIDQLFNNSIVAFGNTIDGRPNRFMQERFTRNQIEMGSFFRGDAEGRVKAQNILNGMQTSLDEATQQWLSISEKANDDGRRFGPKVVMEARGQLGEATNRLREMQQSVADWRHVVDNWGGGGPLSDADRSELEMLRKKQGGGR